MKKHAGFTLVEALVASTISSIIGLFSLSILSTHHDFIVTNSLNGQGQSAYQILMEEIARQTRAATAVTVADGDVWPISGLQQTSASAIEMCDADGMVFAGFMVDEQGQVLEYVDNGGWGWEYFTIGDRTVRILGDDDPFLLSGDRKTLGCRLTMVLQDGTACDTIPSREEVFPCRN